MGRPATDAVVGALRADILSGHLPPGERLDESTLVARLDVSRNTLREAFRVLAHEHVVEHRPNRGVFVRRLSVTEARDLYRTRRILECGALREAAVRRSTTDELATDEIRALQNAWSCSLSRVEQAVADGIRARRRSDWEAVGTANGDFHLALASLAGNEVLDRTLRTLVTELRLLFVAVGAAREVHEPYLDDHIRIASLVQLGELARAAVVLEEYLLRAERELVGRYAEHLAA